jgi:dTMP kinase
MSRSGALGALIAIEGIDGAGKSTLQKLLGERWRRRGLRVVVRREPADAELGAEAQRQGADDPLAGALYFTLDRALVRSSVDRAIASGAIVLQDRSYHSTLAYQGSALSTDVRLALFLLQVRVTPEPDRVLWLDLPPAMALARIHRRGRRTSPLERRATLDRVRRAYRGMARSPKWIRLDATQPAEEIAAAADRALAGFLSRRRRRGPKVAKSGAAPVK